jgi:hypothetical protein
MTPIEKLYETALQLRERGRKAMSVDYVIQMLEQDKRLEASEREIRGVPLSSI